jgi:hypothetical protein
MPVENTPERISLETSFAASESEAMREIPHAFRPGPPLSHPSYPHRALHLSPHRALAGISIGLQVTKLREDLLG